jgi:hypothetical protein
LDILKRIGALRDKTGETASKSCKKTNKGLCIMPFKHEQKCEY